MATWDINEQYDGLLPLTENDYEPYDKMGRMLIYRLNKNKLYLFKNGVSPKSGGWEVDYIQEEGSQPGTYVTYDIGTTLEMNIGKNVCVCALKTVNKINCYSKVIVS